MCKLPLVFPRLSLAATRCGGEFLLRFDKTKDGQKISTIGTILQVSHGMASIVSIILERASARDQLLAPQNH